MKYILFAFVIITFASCKKISENCQKCYLLKYHSNPNDALVDIMYSPDTVVVSEENWPKRRRQRNKCYEEAETLNSEEKDPGIYYHCSCKQ